MATRYSTLAVAAAPNRKVTLKKDVTKSVRAGHPWIYRDALRPLAGVAAGEIVDVVDAKDAFVARGFADPEGAIGVRVLTLDGRETIDDEFVARRVGEATDVRARVIDPATTDCFRLLHGEGDFLPGVVCDVYAGIHVMRFDGAGARAFGQRVVGALSAPTVYERSREGGELLAGAPPPDEVVVREHGMRLAVDVVRGQKTGFFLDQRENRRRVRELAQGRTVLNMFSYTGGFSVAAALGGAMRTISVDTAAPALEAARRNFELNDLDPAAHEFVCEDGFEWLDRAARRGERYGLVILDPPSFAPNEESLERALRAYRDLNTLGLQCLETGGWLATASCSSHVDGEAFLGVVREASARSRRRVRLLELRGAGPDHPVAPGHPEGRYLKFYLGAVA
jgi:23S rRNA (cytosine1962-C5)-methyltransferase